MSAKGRGEALGGEHEVYVTPRWCVSRLLDRIGGDVLRPGLWLEPCAGYGAIIRACAAHHVTAGRLIWSATEIRLEVGPLLAVSMATTGSPPPRIGDFLLPSDEILHECSVVLTNPPFSTALPFLHRCMAVAPHANVAFLLRTNFISGAEDRYEWLRDHMPDEYRLPDRPVFRGDHADSAEYSWFAWGPGAGTRVRRRGHSELLDPTPLEERKRDLQESQALLSGVEWQAPQLALGGIG